MRVHLIDTLTVGDPYHFQQLDRLLFDSLFGLTLLVMQGYDLVHLFADAEYRI